jgi:hypothetical protein
MTTPYVIGASQVLLHTSLFLAHAANVAKQLVAEDDASISESLEHFERDLVLIHHQISRLFQHPNTYDAASLDSYIQQTYDFASLNQILDRRVLAQALSGISLASTNIQLQVRPLWIPKSHSLLRIELKSHRDKYTTSLQ